MATIASRYSRPQMATVRPGVMEAIERPGNRGREITVAVSVQEQQIGTRVLEIVREKKRGDKALRGEGNRGRRQRRG